MLYAILIEKSETGFGAYVPELPGCVAVAEDEAEVRHLIREAIEFISKDSAPARDSATRNRRRRLRSCI